MGAGRFLIVLGVVLVVAGIVVTLVPVRFGRLPGDIVMRGKNTTFYFPLMTSILISVILTLVMWLFNRR